LPATVDAKVKPSGTPFVEIRVVLVFWKLTYPCPQPKADVPRRVMVVRSFFMFCPVWSSRRSFIET